MEQKSADWVPHVYETKILGVELVFVSKVYGAYGVFALYEGMGGTVIYVYFADKVMLLAVYRSPLHVSSRGRVSAGVYALVTYFAYLLWCGMVDILVEGLVHTMEVQRVRTKDKVVELGYLDGIMHRSIVYHILIYLFIFILLRQAFIILFK